MSPLSATIQGRSIVAPLISNEEWASLRGLHLILACCGARGFGRTSVLGTRHFVHYRKSECSFVGESLEHLELKAQVVKALAEAGIAASSEVSGPGWRTDVLAAEAKVAFEIQLSSQSAEETLRRSAALADSGIQAIWLFRRRPRMLPFELPAFELERVSERSWNVRVGAGASLATLVKAASGGRLSYADQATVGGGMVSVTMSQAACRSCGSISLTHRLSREALTTCCGTWVWAVPSSLSEALDLEAHSKLTEYLRSHSYKNVQLAAFDPRIGRRRFACPNCTNSALQEVHAWFDDVLLPTVKIEVGATRFEHRHWCIGKARSA